MVGRLVPPQASLTRPAGAVITRQQIRTGGMPHFYGFELTDFSVTRTASKWSKLLRSFHEHELPKLMSAPAVVARMLAPPSVPTATEALGCNVTDALDLCCYGAASCSTEMPWYTGGQLCLTELVTEHARRRTHVLEALSGFGYPRVTFCPTRQANLWCDHPDESWDAPSGKQASINRLISNR